MTVLTARKWIPQSLTDDGLIVAERNGSNLLTVRGNCKFIVGRYVYFITKCDDTWNVEYSYSTSAKIYSGDLEDIGTTLSALNTLCAKYSKTRGVS